MNAAEIASVLAIRNQLHNYEETLASLLRIITSLPDCELRDELMAKVTEFNEVANLMKQALDALRIEKRSGSS